MASAVQKGDISSCRAKFQESRGQAGGILFSILRKVKSQSTDKLACPLPLLRAALALKRARA